MSAVDRNSHIEKCEICQIRMPFFYFPYLLLGIDDKTCKTCLSKQFEEKPPVLTAYEKKMTEFVEEEKSFDTEKN